MDASSLYPRGFHPVIQEYLRDLTTKAPVVHRQAAWPPVRYYFVHSSTLVRIPREVYPRVVFGNFGLHHEAPELSDTMPYDPFKLDVYMLGTLYRRKIYAVCDFVLYNKRTCYVPVQKYSNVNFLRPLIFSMINYDPNNRPDAEQALERWRHIRGAIWILQRGCRLRRRSNPKDESVVFDILAFLKLCVMISRRYLIWTARWLSLFRQVQARM
jgi:hypothetical protein